MGESDALLRLYEMPGHLIRRLQQIAVSLYLDETAGFDVTSVQYAALKAIQAYPGIDQATLAGAIAYDRATIGGVIDRLEAKGLVKRFVHASDRRIRCLHLEPAGAAMIEKIEPAVARAQERILGVLDPSEQKAFIRLMMKLTDTHNQFSRVPLRRNEPA